MKRMIVSALAVATMSLAAPAAYGATFPVGGSNFTATPGPNGTFAGAFFNTGIAAGAFTDIFTFTLPANGFGSGTVTTSATLPGSANDLDFTSVFVNDVAAQITRTEGGLFEVAFTNNVPIVAGVLNRIVVNGVSRGGGAYGGQATFSTVAAVPEAATWAMMLVGFGMIGAATRYRRRATNVRYA
ncbi:FxDxF family PEP-CTERM protein [Sphingomonas sp. CFBP 8760]|jgi:hypothetical protein|uniref:FxDxF family PEP-CTERM protein n=1 Tax=Sphingomonas sp. CFBP 8760 TaxID=2775282 RepID=UPI0017846E5F|nr:FxDxF family PEP-CTERM protein [Sphingomonas sp. CFBP 8760]MBD8549002.1 FxDxF family PEP-CTERM protein [Sphingomonas sp. CFBP 8760]